MLDPRAEAMLQQLYKSQGVCSWRELAAAGKVSLKTARNLLEEAARTSEEEGFSLDFSKRGKVSLIQTDPVLFQSCILHTKPDPQVPAISKSAGNARRMQDMLSILLTRNDYAKIEDLADSMYVSRSTLDRLLPDMKKFLAEYHLQITAKPRKGIRIEGSEFHKRICLAHCQNRDPESDEQITATVQKVLLDVISEYKLQINDNNFYNLIQHCVIAIRRIADGNQMEEIPPFSLDNTMETQAARSIVLRLEDAFQIQFSKAEEAYISIHLMGKRVLDLPDVIQPVVYDLVDAIFTEIRQRKTIDFSQDDDLRTALALHLQPLLSRLYYGLQQDNPLIHEIKADLSLAYELAMCAVEVIHDKMHLKMDEDEAGYLALHFALALEKQKSTQSNQRVLIVCTTGRGTSRLFCHRLLERYQLDSSRLVPVSAFQLANEDMQDVLCILTTIPLPLHAPVPVFTVDLLMGPETVKKLDGFFLKHALPRERSAADDSTSAESGNACGKEAISAQSVQNPEIFGAPVLFLEARYTAAERFTDRMEILAYMADACQKKWSLSEDFSDQVLRREELSTTEVGNETALPHPYAWGQEQSYLCCMVLPEKVLWKFQPVRLVLLCAFGGDTPDELSRISSAVTALAVSEQKTKKLINNPNFETLKSVLEN